jgi:SAM-dependent methyltransferase
MTTSQTPGAPGASGPGETDGPTGGVTASTRALNPEKLARFADLVGKNETGMAVGILACIGDQLGLFRALDVGGPATSAQLAERAGISERYAREWLGAMTCAGYVEYEPASGSFTLPPEHACVLAEEDGPFFVGGALQFTLALAGPMDEHLRAFRDGRGVSQSAYDARLWEGMERSNAPWFEHGLVQRALPLAPAVRDKLERGAEVADIGSGSGRALIVLARAFPKSRYTGYDVFAPNIARAQANAEAAGVADRLHIEERDASQGLPEAHFDVITSFDVVHDAADPPALLRAIYSALRTDGIYLCMEPRCEERLEDNVGARGAFLYSASALYCMTTALARGGVGLGTAGLPESRLRALCLDAGFSAVRRLPLLDVAGTEDRFSSLYEIRP